MSNIVPYFFKNYSINLSKYLLFVVLFVNKEKSDKT